MKKSTLFLALSLAVNAAFAAVFFLRPASTVHSSDGISTAPEKSASAAAKLSAAQLTALQSGDIAQLKAAGMPEDVARLLVVGRAYAKLQAAMRNLRKPAQTADGKYWRGNGSPFNFTSQTKEQRAESTKAQREFSESLRAAFGDDASMSAYTDSRYGFLSSAKREQIRRIEQDYNEMQSDIYNEINGIQLPSDREKLKLLRQEKERDITAAMTPEEYEQYNLHSSQTAMNVRSRYGDAIQTEDDYKKIFALQKAYDAQYSLQDLAMSGQLTPETMSARRAAEIKLQEDIKAAIGPDNLAAFQKASDQDYKALTSVAKRLNLPPETADNVFASRDTYAAASQRISADTSLSPADRRAQLTALGTQAKADLTQTLGAEGAEAYAARAQWMTMLKNGNAFSTNPKDAPPGRFGMINSSVYPIMTARPARPAPTAPQN